MAERNHLRIADQNDLPNDDPFAELTRIMGFDPRQPVREQSANEPEANADEVDFGIDLEKELMGDLAAEEAAPAAHAAFQSYEEAVEPAALDADAVAELDEASFEIAAFEDELTAALQDGPALSEDDAVHDEQIAAAFEQELSLADDFMVQGEEAIAAAPAEAEPVEAEPVEAFDAVAEEAFSTDLEAATAGLAEVVQAEPSEGAVESEPYEAAAEEDDFAFDAALEEELARDSAQPADVSVQSEAFDEGAPATEDLETTDGNWAAEAEDYPVSDFTPEQPAAPDMSSDVFAGDFSAAHAEVDMNFSDMRAAVDEPSVEDADLDRELQSRLDEVGEAEAFAEPDIDEPGEERDELSLEDELNALLGNLPVRAPFVAEVAAVEAAPEISDSEPELQAVAEIPQTEPVEAALAGDEQNLLHDLAGDLDAVNWAFDAAEPVEPQVSHAPEDGFRPDDAGSARQPDFELDDRGGQPAYAVADESAAGEQAEAEIDLALEAADFDLDFDDEAFDAAISNGIAGDEPVLQAADDGSAPAWQEPAQAEAKENDDPYAALAALTASMRRVEPAPNWQAEVPAEALFESRMAADYDDVSAPSAAYEDFPDIETIDVPEHAVALADDLEIPELAVEENVPPAAVYDDLDAEFAGLLAADTNAPETAPAPAPAFHADDYAAEFERAFARQEQSYPVSSHAGPAAFAAGLAGGAAFAGASHATHGSAADNGQRDPDYVPGSKPAAQNQFAVDDYDPELDEEMSMPEYGARREQPQRRGMLVAAVVGGVAVLGGLGAFAMSFGEGGSNEPAVVKADTDPVKVRPENPGGTTVPNQDKAVYDRVAGSGAVAQPRQEKLLTSAEEPIDVPAPEPRKVETAAPASQAAAETPAGEADAVADTVAGADLPQPIPGSALPQTNLPGVTQPAKSEDRIAQVLQENDIEGVEVAAVAPRKVRTMIVKADGTLVPREDPEPAAEAPAAAPAANAGAAQPTPSAPESTGTVPPAAAPAMDAPQASAESATPNSVPLAPARPSDQPVDIVGEVKTEQVAALAPASAANGAWSMQIASQPSEAAAQSSYQDLLRRYGGVLEGRQANIVKAEIAGKGTFWRVRIPTGSRDDAIKLCESYKSAGGNCFVSK